MDEQTNPIDAPQSPSEAPLFPMTADADARMWAMLCHLSAFSAYFSVIGGMVGPLIVWLVKKDIPFVDEHGKESLNFQISMFLYHLIGVALIFCFFLGVPVLAVLSVINIVLIIVAAVKANNGEPYRYPMTIRLIQ